MIDYEDVSKLEYVVLVIKETLRLYPPGAVTFRTTQEELTIDGFPVPANTVVVVSTMLMLCPQLTFYCMEYWPIL